MNDAVQLLPLFFIVKNNFSHLQPVQRSIGKENMGTEDFPQPVHGQTSGNYCLPGQLIPVNHRNA